MLEEPKQPIAWSAMRKMFAPMYRPHVFLMVVILLLTAMIAALTIAEPYIYGSIVDLVTAAVTEKLGAAAGFATIMPFLGYWLGVVVLVTLLATLNNWLVWYLGNRVCYMSNTSLFRRMLNLTISRFQDERAGALLHRFTTTDEALWMVNLQTFRSFLQPVVTFVLTLSVGFLLDWRLTLVTLAVIPLVIAMGFWQMRTSSIQEEKMMTKWEEANGLVGDAFANITTVQSEAGESLVAQGFLKTYVEVLKKQLRLNVQWAIVEAGSNGVFIIGRLAIFFVGIQYVLAGETTLGTLIMFLGFAGVMFSMIQSVMHELPAAIRSLNRMSRAARIWEEVPEVHDLPGARSVNIQHGEVEFDRVSFHYPDNKANVLKDVSFKIPAGKMFAIVGESGAGKSSLAKLMVRFADPSRGTIRIDGVDLRDMKLESLRPQVGFVMQENLLFHQSITYNLRFGKPNATEEEIVIATKRAQAHAFILKLKNGYDTVVGERGVKLSGGQKQRIALARTLLANPPILVLDEATSALDSKTEQDLQIALREVMKNRTVIVIAHRLSTIMDADNILVMDKGKIIDQGRHEELISRGGLYKQYWAIQARGYEE